MLEVNKTFRTLLLGYDWVIIDFDVGSLAYRNYKVLNVGLDFLEVICYDNLLKTTIGRSLFVGIAGIVSIRVVSGGL